MRAKHLKLLLMQQIKFVWSAISYPLTIIGKTSRYIDDYYIYGNSVQVGESTPDTPIEVQSVGDLVTEGEYAGKYKVPVTVRGKNLWNKDATKIRYDFTTEYSKEGDRIIAKGAQDAEYAARSGAVTIYLDYSLPANKQYTISLYATPLEKGIYSSSTQLFLGKYPDNYVKYWLRFYTLPAVGTRCRYSYTFTPTTEINAITFRLNTHKWLIELDTIQVEEYSSPSECEPYIKPVTTDIYLDKPIASGESINYRADKLPPLLQFKGTTIYETETLVKPDGIQAEYY